MEGFLTVHSVFNFGRALCLVVPALLLTGCFEETGALQGRVVRVSDGDTVVVLDSAQQEHKIRLAGIDAPEKAQAFGSRSKEALSAVIYNHQVSVILGKTDQRFPPILNTLKNNYFICQ